MDNEWIVVYLIVFHSAGFVYCSDQSCVELCGYMDSLHSVYIEVSVCCPFNCVLCLFMFFQWHTDVRSADVLGFEHYSKVRVPFYEPELTLWNVNHTLELIYRYTGPNKQTTILPPHVMTWVFMAHITCPYRLPSPKDVYNLLEAFDPLRSANRSSDVGKWGKSVNVYWKIEGLIEPPKRNSQTFPNNAVKLGALFFR